MQMEYVFICSDTCRSMASVLSHHVINDYLRAGVRVLFFHPRVVSARDGVTKVHFVKRISLMLC